jgi:hypothetical protein
MGHGYPFAMKSPNPPPRNGCERSDGNVMIKLLYALGAVALAGLAALPARAAYPGHQDPDWPCMAIKVPDLSLAAVWAGPPVDAYKDTWSQDPQVAGLAERLAERRLPLEDAEAQIQAFAKQVGNDRNPKLLALTAGLFSLLNGERSSVIAGLDRFGARQIELADAIRSKLDKLHGLEGQAQPDEQQIASVGRQLQWETQMFQERRQVTQYVCQVPDQIEHRFFALARVIQQNLNAGG